MQRLAVTQRLQVNGDDPGRAAHVRCGCDVGQHGHLWMLPERMLCRQRLAAKHVEHRMADLATFERLQQIIARELGFELVDHRLELYGVPLDRNKKPDTGNKA